VLSRYFGAFFFAVASAVQLLFLGMKMGQGGGVARFSARLRTRQSNFAADCDSRNNNEKRKRRKLSQLLCQI